MASISTSFYVSIGSATYGTAHTTAYQTFHISSTCRCTTASQLTSNFPPHLAKAVAFTLLEPTATGATNPSHRRQPSLPARCRAGRVWVDPCAPQRAFTRVLRNNKGASHRLVAKISAPLVGVSSFGFDNGRVGIETAANLVGTGAAGRLERSCQEEMIQRRK